MGFFALGPARRVRETPKGGSFSHDFSRPQAGALRFLSADYVADAKEERLQPVEGIDRCARAVEESSEPHHVVQYLSRYVHRIAISNSRITAYDGNNVTFRYQDRADGNTTKFHTVTGPEFAKLSLQHVLPPQFVRIRHFGILAVRRRGDLARCRQLLHAPPPTPPRKDATWVQTYERFFGSNPLLCPQCKVGILVVTRVLPPMRS